MTEHDPTCWIYHITPEGEPCDDPHPCRCLDEEESDD